MTWLEKMITAIPLVNPVITGYGMNLIDRAELARRPNDDEDHAGHERRDVQPVDAVLLDDAVDDDDERARRARRSARASRRAREIRKPATIAVKSPRSGVTPLAMANAMASGSATMPTMTPAVRSRANWVRS